MLRYYQLPSLPGHYMDFHMKGHSHLPPVSIGMPVYNGERYLEQTLQSVLGQTFTDFVLYITDNASTDRTEAICREYAARDPRIVYRRNPVNVGAAGNYELCFQAAKSPYFRWQNADDPIEPTLLEDCLRVLEQRPDVVLAYGQTRMIDSEGRTIRDYEDKLDLQQARAADRFIAALDNIDMQNHMYGLIRRDALAHTARLKGYKSADINLIVELALYGKYVQIPKHLFNRRLHAESSSWNMKDEARLKDFWAPSKRKLVMQTWRSVAEYYRAVLRAPIPFQEKFILVRRLLKHVYWRKSAMLSELSSFIRFGLLRLS